MKNKEPTKIVGVQRLGEDAVVVEYSNNVTALYTQDQLAAIKPKKVMTDDDVKKNED